VAELDHVPVQPAATTCTAKVGRGGKPVVASLFAPELPEEVLGLYQKIARWLGPTSVPEEADTAR